MRPKSVKKPRTKQLPSPSEMLAPSLARLIESGKISVRLGPVADVREWLNNYEAFEKSKVAVIHAASVRIDGNVLQIDLGLDDYSS